MATKYYLLNDTDPNVKINIDVSDCPVDGSGNASELDAAHSAIDQLGYTLCAKDEDN